MGGSRAGHAVQSLRIDNVHNLDLLLNMHKLWKRCSKKQQTAALRSSKVEKHVPLILYLQTVQWCAYDTGRFGLAGKLKGQHVFFSLNVAGSGLDNITIPARIAKNK